MSIHPAIFAIRIKSVSIAKVSTDVSNVIQKSSTTNLLSADNACVKLDTMSRKTHAFCAASGAVLHANLQVYVQLATLKRTSL